MTLQKASRRKDTTHFFARGITYAATSICAWLAGYFIQNEWKTLDFIVVLVPVMASVYFFVCYAERFPGFLPGDEADDLERAIGKETASLVVPYFFGIPMSFAIFFAAFLYACANSVPFSALNLVGPSLYAAMYYYYGRFLLRHPDDESFPTIRHQLIWPVILSIGLSLYFGLNFPAIQTDWRAWAPVLLLCGVYAITRYFRVAQRVFLIVTLSAFAICTVVTFLVRKHVSTEIGEYGVSLLFCIIVSAYLAVFEAWKLSSDTAKQEKAAAEANPAFVPMKGELHSKAALLALYISILAMPYFFLFSLYGVLFLILFGLHAVISFGFWSWQGVGEKLFMWDWGKIKVVTGVIFLGILVFSSPAFFVLQPQSRTLSIFVVLTFASCLLGASYFPTKSLNKAITSRNRTSTVKDVFSERINFTRALGLPSAISLFVVIGIANNAAEDLVMKADVAFYFFVFCVLLSIIADIVYNLSNSTPPSLNTSILNYIYAFLILSRAITSALITLAVLIPGLYRGGGLLPTLLFALPFFFAAIGGFALNDYFDAGTDSVNKPYRPIPAGLLSRASVLVFGIVMIAVASVTSFFVAASSDQTVLYLICIVGVGLYNLFVKYLSITKTFITSAVSALPLLFSIISFDYPMIYFLLPVAAAGFVLGREWLMDIRDLEGDRLHRASTVPSVIGSRLTATLGFVFICASCALLVPIAIQIGSLISFMIVSTALVCVLAFAFIWRMSRGAHEQLVIRLLWVPMFLGLLLFVS